MVCRRLRRVVVASTTTILLFSLSACHAFFLGGPLMILPRQGLSQKTQNRNSNRNNNHIHIINNNIRMPKLYSKPSGMQSEEGANTMLVRKRSVNHNNKATTTATTNNNNSNGATDTLPLYEKQESSSSSDLTSATVDTSLSSSSSSSDFATNIVKSFQKNNNNKQDESASPTSAILLLNLVAIIWGSQHSIIKMVVDDSPAASFTLLRFAIGALIASPYTPGWSSMSSKLSNNNDNDNDNDNELQQQVAKAWRWGLEMGVWMFAGFALQAVGLESTTAQRSGFLIYLNVKFVPFFARVLFGKPISIPTWVSAFVAFVGTALLACDGGGQQAATTTTVGLILNVGDLWTIVAAASSAMFILRLEEATLQVEDSASLNAATLWTVFGLSVLWTFFFGGSGTTTTTIVETVTELGRIAYAHPLELIYLGGVTTALSNFIQTKAQKNVSAERACLIYSLDPVYGAVFSYWLLGEQLGGPQAYVGAGMITLAAATNAFLDFGKTTTKKNDDDDDDGGDNELV